MINFKLSTLKRTQLPNIHEFIDLLTHMGMSTNNSADVPISTVIDFYGLPDTI